MKKILNSIVVLVTLSTISFTAAAQDDAQQMQQNVSSPKWISDNGYWVLEGNVKTPKNNTIYFYSNDNSLVYKEELQGVKINVKRQKTLMRLKNVLDQSVTAWQQQHISKENQNLVVIALK